MCFIVKCRLYKKASQIATTLSDGLKDKSSGEDPNTADNDHEGGSRPPEATGLGLGLRGDGKPAVTFNRDSPGCLADVSTGPIQPEVISEQPLSDKLEWPLISRLNRARWERAMASCCLGLVLRNRYGEHPASNPNAGSVLSLERHLALLTEHAIRGLMLLGAPHPSEFVGDKVQAPTLSSRKEHIRGGFLQFVFCCGQPLREEGTSQRDTSPRDSPSGISIGLRLTEDEVGTVRDTELHFMRLKHYVYGFYPYAYNAT